MQFALLVAIVLAAHAQTCPNIPGYDGYQQKISAGGGVSFTAPNNVWHFAFNLCGPVTKANTCQTAKPSTTPLWGCQSYDPDVGKVIGAGNNNFPPNANPNPGTWTVEPYTLGDGLVFYATGGDATSTPGCYLSMRVIVLCDRGAPSGITAPEFVSNAVCPNKPFDFRARSSSACLVSPSPSPSVTRSRSRTPSITSSPGSARGDVLFGPPKAGTDAYMTFNEGNSCRSFNAELVRGTECSLDPFACAVSPWTIQFEEVCAVPVLILSKLTAHHQLIVGIAATEAACAATNVSGAFCFDATKYNVMMRHDNLDDCLTDFQNIVVLHALVGQFCRTQLALMVTRSNQEPSSTAMIRSITGLKYSNLTIVERGNFSVDAAERFRVA